MYYNLLLICLHLLPSRIIIFLVRNPNLNTATGILGGGTTQLIPSTFFLGGVKFVAARLGTRILLILRTLQT